jgi:DNA-binding protein HU-alpha
MAATPKPPASATKPKAAAPAKPAAAAKPSAKAATAKAATAKSAAAKAPATKPAVAKAPAAKPSTARGAVKAAAPAAKPRPVPRAKPAPSPEAQVAAAASALVSVVGTALSIRKKELVERVVAASGAKKKQVKEIVEHTLKALGDALAKGEELNLPPFGKAKVNRSKDSDSGTTMMVKLKQGGDKAGDRKAARKSKEGLAADGD